MATRFEQTQAAMAFAARHLDGDVTLEHLADEAGLSRFHLHRVFSATAGETPKEYTTRLRLWRACAALLGGDDSILRIALDCGFESHEGFTRAFRRHFGMTPSAYRKRGFATPTSPADADAHAHRVADAAPCIGLFRYRESTAPERSPMSYSISKKSVSTQSVLVQRKRASQGPEISKAIGDGLGAVFAHAQQNGFAITGRPFARYLDITPASMTFEPGVPIAAPDGSDGDGPPSDPEAVHVSELPGGSVAFTLHEGPYDTLHEAYAALEKWIEAEGLSPNGAPWEVYVTDPTQVEDPADWQTEVYWPVS